MEEDLFSLAAGKQPSQQATNETASRAGEARENAGAGHPGNAEETAPRRIDYLRAELRREPDARDDARQGAYLQNEALTPPVPDGQRQHEADDQINSVQKQRSICVRKDTHFTETAQKKHTKDDLETSIREYINIGVGPQRITSRRVTFSALQMTHMVLTVRLVLPASIRLKLDLSMSQRYANSCTVRLRSFLNSLILVEI